MQLAYGLLGGQWLYKFRPRASLLRTIWHILTNNTTFFLSVPGFRNSGEGEGESEPRRPTLRGDLISLHTDDVDITIRKTSRKQARKSGFLVSKYVCCKINLGFFYNNQVQKAASDAHW